VRVVKLIAAVLLLSSYYSCRQQEGTNNRIALAYVYSGSNAIPDPAYITHIAYAFGHVNETFNGIVINRSPRQGVVDDGRPTNEDRLRSIVELKKQKPSLKILLSVGGWGSGRFSEMAAEETNRLAFAADCKRVVDEFSLDGIDMDWEYPTSSSAGISSSPDDMENFTLLMRDIRQAIGKDKLLTFASAATALYIDFKAVDPYVDFINVMSYVLGNPPYHGAGLFRSEFTPRTSVDESIVAHIEAGVPSGKLVLGMPFYGRVTHDSLPGTISYRNLVNLSGFTPQWDDVAKAPYLADAEGKMVVSYEDVRSIAYKCEYLHSKGLRGAMYWHYAHDDDEGTLRKAVYDGVMKKP
jgi:chitinase